MMMVTLRSLETLCGMSVVSTHAPSIKSVHIVSTPLLFRGSRGTARSVTGFGLLIDD